MADPVEAPMSIRSFLSSPVTRFQIAKVALLPSFRLTWNVHLLTEREMIARRMDEFGPSCLPKKRTASGIRSVISVAFRLQQRRHTCLSADGHRFFERQRRNEKCVWDASVERVKLRCV